MLSDERRREIADFLKTRRMRRQPEELGLPRGRRRRTPGLRREEVAAAAGRQRRVVHLAGAGPRSPPLGAGAHPDR